MQRLPIEPVSQASANQRQGRCGRVAAGSVSACTARRISPCARRSPSPEIKRTNLAAVVLQMLVLGLGEVEDFFIDPPDPRMVRDGYRLLEELGAVSRGGKLTAIGRRMARLPVDPRLARMVLAGGGTGLPGRGAGNLQRPGHPGIRGSGRRTNSSRRTRRTRASATRARISWPG